jgi:hypothetical protein
VSGFLSAQIILNQLGGACSTCWIDVDTGKALRKQDGKMLERTAGRIGSLSPSTQRLAGRAGLLLSFEDPHLHDRFVKALKSCGVRIIQPPAHLVPPAAVLRPLARRA